MSVCVYECACVCVFLYVVVYVCVFTCVYVFMYVCVCVCVCVCVSLDSLEKSYSIVDLIRDFAEYVFQSSGFVVEVQELLLRPVDHELCRRK